jgi:hypothetical protein
MKSVATNNLYSQSGSNFAGVMMFDIGAPPVIPANTPCNINVKDAPYYAVGNGTSNDTTKIQAALDAASDGNIIYFPPGNYLITAPLSIRSSVTLLGDGFSISKLIAGTNLDSMICGDATTTNGIRSGVLISKLAFSGIGWNVTQAIKMNKMTSSTVDRVSIRDISGNGIGVPPTYTQNTIRSSSIHVRNVQILLESSYNTVDSVYAGGGMYTNGCAAGVQITGGARYTSVYSSHFDATVYLSNGLAGVYFVNPSANNQGAIIRNCYFDQHQQGVFFDYAALTNARVFVEGCIFRDIRGTDYRNRNAEQVYLHGNVFAHANSSSYIYHDTGNQNYIEVVGNIFKQQRTYTLPGSNSVDAANTTQ